MYSYFLNYFCQKYSPKKQSAKIQKTPEKEENLKCNHIIYFVLFFLYFCGNNIKWNNYK